MNLEKVMIRFLTPFQKIPLEDYIEKKNLFINFMILIISTFIYLILKNFSIGVSFYLGLTSIIDLFVYFILIKFIFRFFG